MAAGKEKGDDFYGVLGLKKECSATELRDAYKKLALRWHPDRCSASGNLKFVEEAKKKFQSIQEAYSVLSDANKRFLYDIGVYDSDDDENAMGDFLGEMTEMMSQSKPNEGRSESFEELQELFEEMFHEDCCGPASSSSSSSSSAFPPVKDPSTLKYSSINSSTSNSPKLSKRNCSDMRSGNANWSNMYDMPARRTFTLRKEDREDATTARTGRRPSRRKQKMSSSHDVSPHEARIST